ncbi:maestro heat-like repeat family member 5 [Ornithorhynchus anatinus]|uniref:maestro heat-like repeat family member 5 n=1 Tax=Ornithorhynchus anatinus TaxID=9258 RepID=UPI0010A85CF3|nr:maestro heat-like repeat family member 5 [Ornithorhynchus anatinus]
MYLHIHSSHTLAWKTLFLKALTLLTCHHPQATGLLLLEHSLPLDRQALEVWRALGANAHLVSHVLGMLTSRILERPSAGVSDRAAWDKHSLESIAATNVVYELLFAREYSGAVTQFFPRLFLALVTQVHYVLELGLRAYREQEVREPTVPSALGPWRTPLEALKGLLSSQDCWRTFMSMQLQDGWVLFACLETFLEGVVLLARTMVQNRCPVVGALLKAVTTSLPGLGRRD